MLRRVTSRRSSWLQQHLGSLGVAASSLPSRSQLVIGTDCSGAEAPIWSLRSMGIPHTHAFSCDLSPSVRRFIAACSPPAGPVYHDMLRRDHGALPPHSVYVCGFPCTPFSSLRRHSTKLLREPAARPFFATVEVIRQQLPHVAIMENVVGIRAVMKHVVSYFVKLRWYHVLVIPIDSAQLGEPVRRPRYYFVLIRKDVSLIKDRLKLESFATALLAAARAPCKDTILERMLPASHPIARDFVAKHRSVTTASPVSPKGPPPRWAHHNEEYCHAHGLCPAVCSSGGGVAGLRSPRTQTAWRLLTRVHASPDLVADLSQSVHRANFHLQGGSPTITPGGIIAVRKAGRIMLPVEKLLAHNFPLHRMPVVPNISDKDLESMGGNTMHLASVGVALLIGMAGVDWSAAAARVGQKPIGTMPPAEAAVYVGTAEPERLARKRRLRAPLRSTKARRRSE